MFILYKKIIIISSICLIVLLTGFIIGIKYHERKKEEITETFVVTGVITAININSFIVKDSNSSLEYSVICNTTEFKVGDIVTVFTKDPTWETFPIGVKASRIQTLEKVNEEENIIQNDNENKEDIIIPNKNKDSSESDNNLPLPDNRSKNPQGDKTEADVIAFFITVDNELDKTTPGESIKKSFVTLVDFIFYDGDIYGYKFSELTSSAKLQVLKIAMSIDSKIETAFPGYKESISKTTSKVYTGVKNKIIEKYLDLSVSICISDGEICNQAKQDFQDMKNSFSLTWDFIVSLTKNGISKLSDWYIIWKG